MHVVQISPADSWQCALSIQTFPTGWECHPPKVRVVRGECQHVLHIDARAAKYLSRLHGQVHDQLHGQAQEPMPEHVHGNVHVQMYVQVMHALTDRKQVRIHGQEQVYEQVHAMQKYMDHNSWNCTARQGRHWHAGNGDIHEAAPLLASSAALWQF